MKRIPKIIIAMFALFILMAFVFGCGSKTSYSTRQYTTGKQTKKSYSSDTNARPTCPPVNREEAMSKETAERLEGTGYHGCRPNSPAERKDRIRLILYTPLEDTFSFDFGEAIAFTGGDDK